jgi:protein phosphatase 1 regulatory subunit 11
MQTRDENVEDNEGLGRKSSKRCCIFHKQRDFGESSTDSSDNDSDDDSDSSDREGTKGSNKNKEKRRNKIARPKQSKVPSYQRYHA